MPKENGISRREQFFPRFKPGVPGSTFKIGSGRDGQVDALERNIKFPGECGGILRFKVRFRAREMVVEVDCLQFISETQLQFAGKEKRGGTVGTAGKTAKDAASGKFCKKLL